MKDNNVKYLLGLNITSIIRNLYGILRAKATVLLLGVFGVGILGQIFTFYSVHSRLVSFGVDTFLINRLGKINLTESKDEYYSTIYFSLIILFFVNVFFIFISLALLNILNQWIFDDVIFKPILLLLILLGPVYTVCYIFEIITQARTDFKRLIIGRNIGNAAGIISFVPLIIYYGYSGIIYSLYAFVISSGIYFLIINKDILKNFSFKALINVNDFFKIFFKLGLTDMSRKTIVFISLMVFRVFIVQFLGIEANGLFHAVWSISFYPDIIMAAFVSFYFPIISGAKNNEEVRTLMKTNFEYINYMMFPFIAVIMLFPDLFLTLLYDKSFAILDFELKILVYFKFFQAIYFFYSITFLGTTHLKAFLISEIARNISLIIFGYILIPFLEIKGAVLSIVLMQIISILATCYFLKKYTYFRMPLSSFKATIKFVFLLSLLLIPLHVSKTTQIIAVIIFLIFTIFIIDTRKYIKLLKEIFRSK